MKKTFFIYFAFMFLFVSNVFAMKSVDEDRKKRHWPGGMHGFFMSNLEKAEIDVEKQMIQLLHYITRCERFPLNLEDAYKPIENGPKKCRPIKPTDEGIVTPWIDPWERPYQIRFHKERRKLQVRSRGRNLNDDNDDIVREAPLGNAGIIFDKEIGKCQKLPSDDKDCVFNRGWH